MSKHLTVTINHRNNSMKIYGQCDFLENNKYVIFDSDQWGFTIRVPGIEDEITPIKVGQNGDSSYFINVHCDYLAVGVFDVDKEESTEDKIVVYY